ncbi:MAG: ATP-dependent carboxylate-amine ligase, partial [Gammaproteobacteria bacterium]|nr:ATP-dependent carboxylate-amine ligase [Gammaproteobacteria bacterium]
LPMPKNGLFHVEIFHDTNGQLLLCEAACRLGGCIVNDEIRSAYGVDIRLEYVKSECIKEYRSPLLHNAMPKGRLLGQLNIPPVKGVLQLLPDDCPYDWVEFYKLNGVIGKRYDKMAFTNGEVVSFLVNGENENLIQSRFHELSNWFATNTIWSSI